MIKVYVMDTCPDCIQIKDKLMGNPIYEVIDIGKHVKNLKEFLRLRDSNKAFDSIKAAGSIGIPCFLFEDGTISFDYEPTIGSSCSIDGKGC